MVKGTYRQTKTKFAQKDVQITIKETFAVRMYIPTIRLNGCATAGGGGGRYSEHFPYLFGTDCPVKKIMIS